MRHCWMIAGLITLGITTAVGAVGLATASGDEPKAAPRADNPKPAAKAVAERPELPLAEKLDRLKANYEDAQRAYGALYRGSTIPQENRAKAAEIEPDYSAVVRRIADLAATAPKDPAVAGRNALDDPEGPERSHRMAAISPSRPTGLSGISATTPTRCAWALNLTTQPNAFRDHLLLGFYASAKCRESKGLVRLALAQYLERKALMVDGARKMEGRPTYTHDDLFRADGTRYTEKEVMPDEDFAYFLHLKQCDAAYIRAEAERLYEEVLAEYGDVPYITARDRLLEALLKQPEPKWKGQTLTDEGRRMMEAGIARRRSTLGQVALARLDDWHNLAVGKFAPEIRGVDIVGKPMTLSSYRGKVVALVFWGTWCGPCMREIPREKALVERMKGRPFAMLGVDADADPEAARKVMEAEGVTWPNWHDGEPSVGSIVKRYHVRGFPTVYVIDAEGKIRSKTAYGDSLDQLVEKLVAEREDAGH